MKTQLNTKNTKKLKVSKRLKSTSHVVALVHTKHTGLRHFKLVEHKHTGKLIHHRHTSHLALIIILIIVGFILLISNNVAQAQSDSGTVSVNAIVSGSVPAVETNETKTSNTTDSNDVWSNIAWFMTPVPIYILAVAITLGFWGGDIFDRKFGSGKYHLRTRKAA